MFNRYGDRTYAQHGEDIILAAIFDWLDMTPSYLDAGAWHPIEDSNTWLLYRRGARGILVEPNPDLVPALRAERPEDIVLECAVGPMPGKAPLYIPRDSDLQNSSLRKEHPESLGFKCDEIEVEVVTLQQIIDEHWNGIFPDLLSLDVERTDYDVLASMDYRKSVPKVICVEAFGANNSAAIRDLLENNGYRFCIRAFHNAIFVRNNLREPLYRGRD